MVTVEVSGDEFDRSERIRLRKTVAIVNGNGEPGLTDRVEHLEKLAGRIEKGVWTIVAVVLIQVFLPVLNRNAPQPAPIQNAATGGSADVRINSDELTPEQYGKQTGYLTTRHAAELLDITVNETSRRCQSGEIAASKVGHRWQVEYPIRLNQIERD